MTNEELNKMLESMQGTMVFIPDTNTDKNIPTLTVEAELTLKLLPFVIDNLQYRSYTLIQQIFKAQDLAKEFINYKP